MTKYPKNCSLKMADGGSVITRWAENTTRGTLRTGQGGHVPGSGSGDKIPAKYEPGEFVVSNDMLDNAPGLREQLHGLRGQVLAAKGMTPAEADAKAVSGGGLRARMGYDSLGNPTGEEFEQTQTAVAGLSPSNQRTGVLPSGVRPVVGGGSNRGGQPQPSSRVSYGESMRSGMPDTSAVVQGTQDDVAASLGKGQYTGAVIKGLRGSLAMVPAVLNDTAGSAVRGAYGILKNPFEDAGRAALGMEDRKPTAAAPAMPTAAPPAPSAAAAPTTLHTAGDATMPGQDPGRGPLLRGQSGTAVDGAAGVSKFVQDGKTLYSNVSTPGSNDALMNGRAGVSTVPGMSRAEIDATLGGRSADQTFGDNAIRAANLRDGVDMNRGTNGAGPSMTVMGESGGFGLLSKEFRDKREGEMAMASANNQSKTLRGQTLSFMAQQAENETRKATAASGEATTRRGQDITAASSDANNRVALRGQDITERDNIRTTNTSLTNSAASNKLATFNALREQGNSDRTFGAGREDAEFTRRETAEKNLHNEIAGMLPPGADGKPDSANAARYVTALNADLSARLSGLERDVKAGKPGAAAALADYNKNGHASLGEGYKRKFIAGMAAKDTIEQGATSRFNPIGGTTTIGNAPVARLRKTGDGFLGFGGEYEAFDAENNRIGTAPARNIEGDGSIIFGKRRNDLRTLIQN